MPGIMSILTLLDSVGVIKAELDAAVEEVPSNSNPAGGTVLPA